VLLDVDVVDDVAVVVVVVVVVVVGVAVVVVVLVLVVRHRSLPGWQSAGTSGHGLPPADCCRVVNVDLLLPFSHPSVHSLNEQAQSSRFVVVVLVVCVVDVVVAVEVVVVVVVVAEAVVVVVVVVAVVVVVVVELHDCCLCFSSDWVYPYGPSLQFVSACVLPADAVHSFMPQKDWSLHVGAFALSGKLMPSAHLFFTDSTVPRAEFC
jgi:hypothetical protein